MSGTTQQSTAPGALPQTGGYAGLLSFQALTNQYAALDSLVRQVVAGKAFAGLVKVMAVTGGGTSGPPTVSVQPLVNQVDGLGNQTPHGVVHGLPCFRIQGGSAAFILDPVVGDIGDAVICDRDISTVKATGAQSGPGSFRSNSWADGCFFGSFLGAAPGRYVMLSGTGTTIVDPTQISLMVGGMGIVITSAGTQIDGKLFLPHVHKDVQAGAADTGPVGP
jgi:hypothetical protein